VSDIARIVHDELRRDYALYSCGYVKYRRKVSVIHRVRNLGRVASQFRWLKRRYKSAWFQCHPSIRSLALNLYNSENPILARLKKTPSFTGGTITSPIDFRGEAD